MQPLPRHTGAGTCRPCCDAGTHSEGLLARGALLVCERRFVRCILLLPLVRLLLLLFLLLLLLSLLLLL